LAKFSKIKSQITSLMYSVASSRSREPYRACFRMMVNWSFEFELTLKLKIAVGAFIILRAAQLKTIDRCLGLKGEETHSRLQLWKKGRFQHSCVIWIQIC